MTSKQTTQTAFFRGLISLFISAQQAAQKKAIDALQAAYGASAWQTKPPSALTQPTDITYQVSTSGVGAPNVDVTFTLGGTGNPGATFEGGARVKTVATDTSGDATVKLINNRDGDDKVTVTFTITKMKGISAVFTDTSDKFEVQR
ncbi:MAG: hypothetical protein HY300_06915 [Verrucomicrobia bacterium]|nr:hypothetical protein [Verrucomicrobiota bacterium]